MSRQDPTNSPEARQRLDELLADDALGSLGAPQTAELRASGVMGNPYHTIVSAVSQSMVPPVAMPLALQKRIEASVPAHLRLTKTAKPQAEASAAMRIGAWAGWAVAAAACVALVLSLRREPPAPQVVIKEVEVIREVPAPLPVVPTPAQARAQLMQEEKQLVKLDFAKQPAGGEMSGDVVWSPTTQSGFMRLANLPALPADLQYQLWIIDAGRPGSEPIDGGVFSVNAKGELIIPFTAKLKVNQPAAFAITVERAGGVVVSKLEKVAAMAKRA